MHGLYLDGHTLCIGAHDMQRNSCVHVLSDPNHLAPRREEHEAPGVSPHGRNAGNCRHLLPASDVPATLDLSYKLRFCVASSVSCPDFLRTWSTTSTFRLYDINASSDSTGHSWRSLTHTRSGYLFFENHSRHHSTWPSSTRTISGPWATSSCSSARVRRLHLTCLTTISSTSRSSSLFVSSPA